MLMSWPGATELVGRGPGVGRTCSQYLVTAASLSTNSARSAATAMVPGSAKNFASTVRTLMDTRDALPHHVCVFSDTGIALCRRGGVLQSQPDRVMHARGVV